MKKLLATFYICLLGIISMVAYATPSTATFDFNDGTSTGLTITKSGNSSYAPLNEKFNNINVLDGYFLGASFTSNSSGVVTIITNASYENISSISFNSAATNGSNPKITISIIDDEDVETVVQTAMVLTSGTVNKWRDTPYSKDLSASPKTGKVKFKLTTGSSGVHAAIDNIVITYSPTPTVAYAVTFNAGSNGSCATSSMTEPSAGTGVTLPAATPNSGYSFNGWYTDASVFAGVAGSNYKPASDITLYAQYLGDATFSPVSASSINGNSNVTVTSTGATTIKYAWTESEVAPGEYSSIAASEGSASISVPNVSGTRYLYVKGVKEKGNEGNVAHVSYSITKVKDPAGLTYETSSVSKETGASAFTNTLTNPHSLSVTYSITNNGTGSTINASTGEVTPGSIVGTETITATSESTADYLAGEASYTLSVVSYKGTMLIKVPVTSGSGHGTITGSIGGTATIALINASESGGGYKFGGEGSYISLTLSSSTFQEGDIINVHTTKAADTGGTMTFFKSNKSEEILATGLAGGLGNNKFILPSAANDESTICLVRKASPLNWNGYVDYIEVFRPLPSVELNESGYATFYGYANFTVSGATAYKAELNAGGDALELTSLSGIIPANSAVILVGSAGATATLSYTNDAATAVMTNNILEGTAVRTTTASLKTKDNFYAFDKTDNKFKIYNGTNFPANKAFFQTGGSLAPSAIRIEFEENGATDIKSVEEKETAVKFFDGGRILIMKNGVVYDALGRVVR